MAESERPLVSLVFLLPLILIYQAYATGLIGDRFVAASRSGPIPITAFALLEEFFELFGATGRHLPALGLLGMLVAAHLFRRDPWRMRPRTLVGMMMESFGWAIPLLAGGYLVARYLPLGPTGEGRSGPSSSMLALCLGAGVYEEMVFRLIGVTALSLILRDLIGIRPIVAASIIVLLSGVLFARYHYLRPTEIFQWRTFLFRTAAGAYFALLYGFRGFGITAASHAAYDLVVVSMVSE